MLLPATEKPYIELLQTNTTTYVFGNSIKVCKYVMKKLRSVDGVHCFKKKCNILNIFYIYTRCRSVN